jgi:hypothetical protein
VVAIVNLFEQPKLDGQDTIISQSEQHRQEAEGGTKE